jgi:carboxyl-terminal processing protease
MTPKLRRSCRSLALAMPVFLAACGGGGYDSVSPPVSCSVAGQQDWLRTYMDDWYYWYALSPKPSPAGFGTVEAYFDALIYRGGGQIPGAPAGTLWPSDRYSGFQSTDSFNRFFGDGQTLGYGVAVAGLEVTEPTPQPNAPLFVRYVEPLSPAAAAGVVRGDRVISVNGVAAATLITAKDFSALTPNAAGDRLTLVLRRWLGSHRNSDLRCGR